MAEITGECEGDRRKLSKIVDIVKDKVGLEVLRQLIKGQIPSFKIPVRVKTNTVFDQKLGYLLMGDKVSERKMNSIDEVKKFYQTLLVALKIMEARKDGYYPTQRDIFYNTDIEIPGTKATTFDQDQGLCDSIIRDIEVLTEVFREELGIMVEPRESFIVGDVKFINRENKKVYDVLANSEAMVHGNIPVDLDNYDITMPKSTRFVLFIEKGAIFASMMKTRYWQKHNCLVATGGGQPSRPVRRLARRLSDEFKLPIFVISDADPWGWAILSVYRIGSFALSYESPRLACPKVKFLGVSCSDIDRYNIKHGIRPATDSDIAKAEILKTYPWFQTPAWTQELDLFLKVRKKIEINNLSEHGFGFFENNYLPEKLARYGLK